MWRTLHILWLVPLGAAITLGVTWGCARWGDHRPASGATSRQDAVAGVPEEAKAYLNDPGYLASFGRDRPTGILKATSRSLVCTRVIYQRWRGQEFLGDTREHELVCFGLPFRAMQYAERSRFSMAAFPEWGFWRVAGRAGGWPYSTGRLLERFTQEPEHVYPLTVLPLGFAANTAFYAGLVAALLVGVPRVWRGVRQWRNRGRGLCVTCGYPRGPRGVCPECGTRWD